MRRKISLKNITLLATSLLILAAIPSVLAMDIKVIGQGSIYVHGSGWFAGYVINGKSGTYTLNISATGGENLFPITDVHLVVLISEEAESGGLAHLSIEGMPIHGFQTGNPPGYMAGGPLNEPDYYGYNDTYIIPGGLTYDEAHWPQHAKQVSVTVQFSGTATTNSKIVFLCYGTDNNGNTVKTSFSNQTMFVIPELAGTIFGLIAMICAFSIYSFKKGKIHFL